MCLATLQGHRVPVHLWAPLNEVESVALDQLKRISALPWVFKHVAAMPDVHYGKGATVGSVIAMKGALAPAAVGVDIGCGMAAVRTSLTANDLPDSLTRLRDAFESVVPVGFNQHKAGLRVVEDMPIWAAFGDLTSEVQDLRSKAIAQCGSLGGGNHFIEVCLDQDGGVWLMLHSGSRNIGKVLAEIHITRAKKLAHNADLPDKDLAVFLAGTDEMAAYRRDLMWAQAYAFANRQAMLHQLTGVIEATFPGVSFDQKITCHHNYVAEETHFGEEIIVTRKGAIRAGLGEMGIIPGSMGTGSFIVEGLGNPESFCSASHGAGRRMSRGEAKRRFSLEDLASQTSGVECRKDMGVLDEIPGAYKDINQVMVNQADLVKIRYSLKQVLCVKG